MWGYCSSLHMGTSSSTTLSLGVQQLLMKGGSKLIIKQVKGQ
jgi:hypothetical protein